VIDFYHAKSNEALVWSGCLVAYSAKYGGPIFVSAEEVVYYA
jgi:hypothetical protein